MPVEGKTWTPTIQITGSDTVTINGVEYTHLNGLVALGQKLDDLRRGYEMLKTKARK
jgi:hypothetical protein